MALKTMIAARILNESRERFGSGLTTTPTIHADSSGAFSLCRAIDAPGFDVPISSSFGGVVWVDTTLTTLYHKTEFCKKLESS